MTPSLKSNAEAVKFVPIADEESLWKVNARPIPPPIHGREWNRIVLYDPTSLKQAHENAIAHLSQLAKEDLDSALGKVFQELQEGLAKQRLHEMNKDLIGRVCQACKRNLSSQHSFRVLTTLAAAGFSSAIRTIVEIMAQNSSFKEGDVKTAQEASDRFAATVLSQQDPNIGDLQFLVRCYFKGSSPFRKEVEYSRDLQLIVAKHTDSRKELELAGISLNDFKRNYTAYLEELRKKGIE